MLQKGLNVIKEFANEKHEPEKVLMQTIDKQPKLIQRTFTNKIWEAMQLSHIGNIYVLKNQQEKALEYFNQALNIYKDNNDEYGIEEMQKEIKKINFNTTR